jgi:hypothetical protein
MALHIAGFWLVGVPVSVVFGFGFEIGPVGLWWGLAVGLGVVALLLLARVRRRLSGELQRLIIEDAHHGAVDEIRIGPVAGGAEEPERRRRVMP